MTLDNINTDNSNTTNSEKWFDSMVSNLRYDQVLYENEIIEKDKKEAYDAMISGDVFSISNSSRQLTSTIFVTKILEQYFSELNSFTNRPKKIAVELSNAKVLIWAEISENDEKMEDILLLSEAKVNSIFSKYGFNISSIIVEDTDEIEIPNHYKQIPIN